VKTTEKIKLAPRVKQVVVGKLEMPKRRESPELVCVELAQLNLERVLAARGLLNVYEATVVDQFAERNDPGEGRRSADEYLDRTPCTLDDSEFQLRGN
jgi:hypothetical protein